MPIYEYKCPKCGYQFETIHGVADLGRKKPCPQCGKEEAERVMSVFSCGGTKASENGGNSTCAPSPGPFR
jgi:putative FmdB family regulatory protein